MPANANKKSIESEIAQLIMDSNNINTVSTENKTLWKEMYSEEDMVKFAEFVATYLDKNRNVNGEMLHAKSKYDDAERTIDLLKQYKKK